MCPSVCLCPAICFYFNRNWCGTKSSATPVLRLLTHPQTPQSLNAYSGNVYSWVKAITFPLKVVVMTTHFIFQNFILFRWEDITLKLSFVVTFTLVLKSVRSLWITLDSRFHFVILEFLPCFLLHTKFVLLLEKWKLQTRSEQTLMSWCFSDRASWIDYILITNFCALIIIYS